MCQNYSWPFKAPSFRKSNMNVLTRHHQTKCNAADPLGFEPRISGLIARVSSRFLRRSGLSRINEESASETKQGKAPQKFPITGTQVHRAAYVMWRYALMLRNILCRTQPINHINLFQDGNAECWRHVKKARAMTFPIFESLNSWPCKFWRKASTQRDS